MASSAPLLDAVRDQRSASIPTNEYEKRRVEKQKVSNFSSALDRHERRKIHSVTSHQMLATEHPIISCADNSIKVFSGEWLRRTPQFQGDNIAPCDNEREFKPTIMRDHEFPRRQMGSPNLKVETRIPNTRTELICGVDQFFSAEESVV